MSAPRTAADGRERLEDEEEELCIRLSGYGQRDRTPHLSGPIGSGPQRRSHPERRSAVGRAFNVAAAGATRRVSTKGRSREVVLKVLSTTTEAGGLRRHVRYITRNGELDHRRESGETLEGERWREFVDEVLANDTSRRKNRGLTVNLMVSVPVEVEQAILYETTEAWVAELAPGHRSLIVVHEDTPHPHAHVVIARQGPGRERFRLAPGAFQAARARFAELAREQGMDVTATPRRMTGRARNGQGRRKWEKAKREGRRCARTAAETQRERSAREQSAADLRRLAEVRTALGDRSGAELARARYRAVRREVVRTREVDHSPDR